MSATTEILAGATSPRTARPSRRHNAAFWIIGYTFAVTMACSALPTPLYVLYQARDGFSTFMLTVIFAAYAAGVVASLFLAGHLSDWAGRRRMVALAVATNMVSGALFLLWPATAGLLLARVVSGVSIGMAAMLAGLALVTAAAWLPSFALLLAGGVVAGAGAGAAFRGLVATVIAITPAAARGEGLAGLFLGAYLGLVVPVVGLGVATLWVSMQAAVLGLAVVLAAVLAASARRVLA